MIRVVFLVALLAPGLVCQVDKGYKPVIPKVWDDAVMQHLELPLARPEYSPKHVSETF